MITLIRRCYGNVNIVTITLLELLVCSSLHSCTWVGTPGVCSQYGVTELAWLRWGGGRLELREMQRQEGIH